MPRLIREFARLRVPLAAVSAVFLVSGCVATQSVQQIERLATVRENARIVLMPPDIRYYLLTTGGVPEPNAEWTRAAQENFAAAVHDYAASRGTEIKILEDSNLSPLEIRYEQLHSAVGMTILSSHFGSHRLPSKNGAFDWTLGPGVRAIAEQHDADYALFVFYRDYQASGGRVAFAILAAVAGAYTDAGSEGGFASLVDLQTGDIVWFNVVSAGAGELRDETGAAAAVNTLFKDIPTNEGP